MASKLFSMFFKVMKNFIDCFVVSKLKSAYEPSGSSDKSLSWPVSVA